MEKRLSDRSSDAVSIYPQGRQFFVANLHQNSPNRDSSKIEQRQTDQFIFSEAVQIAGDWLDASGGSPLDIKQYDNLFRSGYASHPSPEILRIFHDWEDFQQISATYHQDRLAEEEQKHATLLEGIQQERKLGLLPEELFKETICYTVRYCEVDPKDGVKGKVKKLQRSYLTENEATTEKIFERYAKYRLINYLLKDKSAEDQPSVERKTGMALGFNIDSGKSLSSFRGSLKNSNALLSDADIDEAIDELNLHHLIYQEYRADHLKALLSIGGVKNEKDIDLTSPEYYYDHRTRKIILLGGTALRHFALGSESDYLGWLHSIGQVSFSKNRDKILRGVDKSRLSPLDELLTSRGTEVFRANDQRNKYKTLSKDLYISYGHLLLNLTGELNGFLVERGRDLSIGPGPMLIKNNFTTLPDFFEEIGIKNKQDMAAWKPEMLERYVRQVFDEHGEVNIPLIRKLYQDAPLQRPSVHAIQRNIPGGLTRILESINLPTPPTKPRSVDELLYEAIELAESLGRVPKTRELSSIASTVTFQKHFGSISACQELIQQRLLESNLEMAA